MAGRTRGPKIKSLVIAVDFDGTIVQQHWPNIGTEMPGAIATIKQWHNTGHKIIINTCRSKTQADDALKWLIQHNVPFDQFNENLPELIKRYGGDTRKISADVYIDDKNIFMRNVNRQTMWQQFRTEISVMSMSQ